MQTISQIIADSNEAQQAFDAPKITPPEPAEPVFPRPGEDRLLASLEAKLADPKLKRDLSPDEIEKIAAKAKARREVVKARQKKEAAEKKKIDNWRREVQASPFYNAPEVKAFRQADSALRDLVEERAKTGKTSSLRRRLADIAHELALIGIRLDEDAIGKREAERERRALEDERAKLQASIERASGLDHRIALREAKLKDLRREAEVLFDRHLVGPVAKLKKALEAALEAHEEIKALGAVQAYAGLKLPRHHMQLSALNHPQIKRWLAESDRFIKAKR